MIMKDDFINAYLKIISEASKGKKEKHGHIVNASIAGPFRRLLTNENPDKLRDIEAMINGDKADIETIDEFIDYLKGICSELPIERAEDSAEDNAESNTESDSNSDSNAETGASSDEPDDDEEEEDEIDDE